MFYQKRLARLKDILREQNLDAILVSSVPNIVYFTGYSGFSKDEREAYLFVTHSKQYLITDGRYSEAVHREVAHFELVLKSAEATLAQILKRLARDSNIKTAGYESHNITVFESSLLYQCIDTWKQCEVSILRTIKETGEIAAIDIACKLGDKTFTFILGKLKEGVSEKEITYEIEFFIKKLHADISFKPIVAFGANSSVPHHQTGETKLQLNQIVLLDFGVKRDNYCSDMTRTVFFGKAKAEFRHMYQTVLTAQYKAVQYLSQRHSELDLKHDIQRKRGGPEKSQLHRRMAKGGSSQPQLFGKNADRVARNYITSRGYPTIPHSLGHGIGLQVHEAPCLSPSSKDKLQPGMIFSIEPGIYIPGAGGVRIEDLVVLDKSGPKLLTHSPKNLIEL